MWRPVGLLLGLWFALCCAMPVVSCAGQHFTPGLTLKCDGHCRIVPANLDHSPDPAALERPNRRLP